MAKELHFQLSGTDYATAPVKLERKKIYGWTTCVATDKEGGSMNPSFIEFLDSWIINANN